MRSAIVFGVLPRPGAIPLAIGFAVLLGLTGSVVARAWPVGSTEAAIERAEPGPYESPSNLPVRARLAGLSADSVTMLPAPASGPVPVAILVVRATELSTDSTGKPFIRYWLRVVNAHEVPDSFFDGPYSCNPPQVSIVNGDTGHHIYGFCGGSLGLPDEAELGRNELSNILWFGWPLDTLPPSKVYLKLYDTGSGETYYSTTTKLPGAPATSRNGISAVTLESFECQPSATPGACLSSGLLGQPAIDLTARVTYAYDGSYGPDAQLTMTILWVYGTCLIDFSEVALPQFGQPAVSIVRAGTNLTSVSNCASIPSITDRIYALRVCLSDGGVANVATDCKDIPYKREVTFARN